MKTADMDGMPNKIAVLIFTRPLLKYENEPTTLATPTIKRE
jgi:hypothetical protein